MQKVDFQAGESTEASATTYHAASVFPWRVSLDCMTGSTPTSAFAAILRDLPCWIRLHDHSMALTWANLQKASRATQQVIRDADVRYYQILAQRSATTYSVEGLNGLWSTLRAVLPKQRAKRQHSPRDIEHELLQHFEQLEAGTTISTTELTASCLQRNVQDLYSMTRNTYTFNYKSCQY